MLETLRNSGYGCSIGTHFFGAVAYADDVLIMATSVQGLQEMVNLCELHAKENNLIFSTDINPKKSKTMCLAFNCEDKVALAPVKLNILVIGFTRMAALILTSELRKVYSFRMQWS